MTITKHRSTFISYSRVNKDFALKLARELKSEGFPIWLDQLDIPAGARWDDEIEKALRECGIFLAILTPASIASENAKDEIGYAIDHGKRILPILLEECEIPLRMRRFQYVDFTKMNFNEGVRNAKDLLGRLIREESALTPAPVPNVPSASGTSASVKNKERLTQPSKRKSPPARPADQKITQPEPSKASSRSLTRWAPLAAVILVVVVSVMMVARTGFLSGVPTAEDLPSANTPTREVKPTNTVKPTVVVDAPPTEPQIYYVEEFDDAVDWQFFVKDGAESDFIRKIDTGRLSVTITPRENTPWAYLINNAFTYTDVRLEAVVVNNGYNSNGVSLVCRYSNEGWYEFMVSNNGNFSIYAFGPGGVKLVEGSVLHDGASTAIKIGKETNVYTATCKGNELSLEINGVLVETENIEKYNFPEGNIGIGFSSPKNYPVDVGFESLKVTQP